MPLRTTSQVVLPPSQGAPRSAIVFSGGSLKGVAFIGALAALEEAGCDADLVGGTSAGAVVAALVGSGMRAVELRALALELRQLPLRRLRDFNLRGILSLPLRGLEGLAGLLRGDRIEVELRSRLQSRGVTTFADLVRPTFVVAVDTLSGEEVVCTNLPRCAVRPGCYAPDVPVADAVRASISIPGLFVPKLLRGVPCVDGGVRSYLPITVAHALGAREILGITFEGGTETAAQVLGGGVVSVLGRTIDLSIVDQIVDDVALLQADRVTPTILRLPIRSPELTHLHEIPRLLQAGEVAMRNALASDPSIVERFRAGPPP